MTERLGVLLNQLYIDNAAYKAPFGEPPMPEPFCGLLKEMHDHKIP